MMSGNDAELATNIGMAIRKIALACTAFHPTIAYATMYGLMAVIESQTPELVPTKQILARVKAACLAVMQQVSDPSGPAKATQGE
jgi:hypothetical protein